LHDITWRTGRLFPCQRIAPKLMAPQLFLREAGPCCKLPVSRILFKAKGPATIIPLGAPLLTRSSDLPGGCGNRSTHLKRAGPARNHGLGLAADSLPIWSCSVWGLPCPRALQPGRCALTAPFHPYPRSFKRRRYLLCGTSRRQALTPESRTLSGTLSCGVRTFLPRNATAFRQRSSGNPAVFILREEINAIHSEARLPEAGTPTNLSS
jgi:hypothetical protein